MSHFSPNQGSPETIALQRQLELAHYAQDALHAENERLRARYEELQQVLAGIEQAKERDRKRKREEEVWEGEWRKLKRGLEWVRDREVEKVPAVLFPSKHAVVSSAGRPPRSSFRDSPSISPKQRLIIDPEEASQGHSLDSGSSEDEDSMSDYSDAPQKPKKTQGPQYRQDEILRRENNAILLKSYDEARKTAHKLRSLPPPSPEAHPRCHYRPYILERAFVRFVILPGAGVSLQDFGNNGAKSTSCYRRVSRALEMGMVYYEAMEVEDDC